ncbi:hypothetical protein MycrhDRAFT_1564 [Mycolicibacterium rhodesiae JS60]|nr:hypothetical protein MycrhDRAFT_1564 [Mycolicibacterium rhodesiae JS60]
MPYHSAQVLDLKTKIVALDSDVAEAMAAPIHEDESVLSGESTRDLQPVDTGGKRAIAR